MAQRILVVDDDAKTVALLRLYLERAGYDVLSALDGNEGLRLATEQHPDLIVLDLMLPGIDGLDICHIVRQRSRVPIIMLTARATEDDRLDGLEIGADDYVVKPFSPREVTARVRAVLRRAGDVPSADAQTVVAGALTLDPVRHEAQIDRSPLALTATEFRLLLTLAREPGRVFTRQELIERAFGHEYDGLERTVDMHVRNLRKKVERDGTGYTFIQTVYGVGYRFAAQIA